MKKVILSILALVVSFNVIAQEKPKEVKEETEVKTVKINDGEKISEKKVKVVTREEAHVELDEKDAQKVNQSRVDSNVKVKKTVSVDNDSDNNYDTLSTVTYCKLGDNNYRLTPNEIGFDIAFNHDASTFEKVGTAVSSGSKGHYIVNGKSYNGIGYFDNDGNLIVEYYNSNKNMVETKTYIIKK